MAMPLKERLLVAARTFKERADALPAGSGRDVLLQVSREAKITADFDELLALSAHRALE